MEAKRAGLEQIGFFRISDLGNVFFGEIFEPLKVCIGLCSDQGKIFIVQPEGTGWALLRLFVEL